MQQNKSVKFKVPIELEMEYNYNYSEGTITVLSSTISAKTTNLIRHLVQENAAEVEIFERLADESAMQLPLFDTETGKSFFKH